MPWAAAPSPRRVNGAAAGSAAVQRRRRYRQEERERQKALAWLLPTYLDPSRTCWTAFENRPRNAIAGMLQRARGVKAGVPDVQVVFRTTRREQAAKLVESGISQRQAAKLLGVDEGTVRNDLRNNSAECAEKPRTETERESVLVVWIELKSRSGMATPAQKRFRDEVLASGAKWWMCRSVHAVMVALQRSGVPFRLRWQPSSPLEAWEGPFADPNQRLPVHPDVAARRKAESRGYRERVRARRAAQLALESLQTTVRVSP